MSELELQGEAEYLNVLRIALHAGPLNFKIEDTVSTRNAQHTAHSRTIGKLFEGILFSRKLILSYQLVLLGFLLLFTSLHWLPALLLRWNQRRQGSRERHVPGIETGRSSSSSTLNANGATIEPFPKLDEQTPLLHGIARPQPFYMRMIYNFKAFLVYQPSNFPIVNKTLPSNGCTMLIMLLYGLQIFYVFYEVPLSVATIFIFADRTALVFVANLPLLYLFAAKNQPIKYLTGKSYETLNIFHRRLGETMCLLALLHSAGMLGVWYTILRPNGFTLGRFIASKIILLGLLALVAYEAIYFTSLNSFRQRWYELFLGSHIVLQSAALILLFFHHSGSRPYVAVALFVFLIDRLVHRIALKSYSAKASLKIKADGCTVSVNAQLPLRSKKGMESIISRPGLANGWQATDHVFLSVPSLAKKHWIQAHPFTIASRAPNSSQPDAEMELIIRTQDGFSKDLLRYAQSNVSTMVRLDGPYGSRSAIRMLRDSELAVIIVGGSGIAVGRPLLWSILESQEDSDAEPATEPSRCKNILLIWVVRRSTHLKWLKEGEIENMRKCGVDVVIPPPTGTNGHPDIQSYVTSWFVDQELGLGPWRPKIGLICSGPDGMNRTVRNIASSLISKGHRVDVEVEKFGW